MAASISSFSLHCEWSVSGTQRLALNRLATRSVGQKKDSSRYRLHPSQECTQVQELMHEVGVEHEYLWEYCDAKMKMYL